jgi:hypothetical protein
LRQEELGEPRFEYRPLPASPISVALLMVTVLVAAIGLPLASIGRGFYGLWWLWVAPPVLVAVAVILARPGPLRIYEKGLELPLPLWKRLLGFRCHFAYDEIVNLYPRLYYVAGALMSPFAASVGTVEHMGLGIELRNGKEEILRFTPGIPRFSRGEDEGYRMVVKELRVVFRNLGRPWVVDVQDYTVEEIERMKREAARPLMSFPVIVLSFFSPVAIIPLLYTALLSTGEAIGIEALMGVVLVGISPTIAMLLISWKRSRRRHRYLREVSKYTEWKRSSSAPKRST